MLDKITNHYSFNGVGSVYDEEALTALELSARTAKKVNEVVDAQNKLDKETHNTLDKFENETIPETVKSDVEKHIESGDFAEAVDKHYGDLEARVDNLAGHVGSGSVTTMDAEVIDARVDNLGTSRPNAGTSVRAQILDVFSYANASAIQGATDTIDVRYEAGEALLTFSRAGFDLRKGNESTIIETVDFRNMETCMPITSYFSEVDGKVVIRIPVHSQLVYSKRDNRIYIRQQNRLVYGDILLLANAYGRLFDGILLKEMDAKARENIVKALGDMDTSVKKLRDREKVFPYIGLGDRAICSATPTKNGTGASLIKLPRNINVLCGVNYSLTLGEDTLTEYTFNNYVAELAPSYVVLRMPANTVLALDYEGKTVGIMEARHLTHDHVVLLVNNWEMLSEGLLLPFFINMELGELDARVKAVEAENTVHEEAVHASVLSALMNTDNRYDAFLFATDFHPVETGRPWWETVNAYVNHLRGQFNKTSADFIVSGGDWLTWDTTPEEACHALSTIYGKMRGAFGEKGRLLLGNHDTNYQGTQALSRGAINSIWFKEEGKAFYTFETVNAKYFMFDSGLDWYPEMDENKNAQVSWFIEGLKTNTKPFMVLGAHMVYIGDGNPSPFASVLCEIADAFNRRVSYTFNGVTHSFADGVGSVKFFFGGHTHSDRNGNLNGIPYFLTKNYHDGNSFDYVFADFDANKVTLIREGTGNNRTVDITTNEPAPKLSGVWTVTGSGVDASTFPQEETFEADVTGQAIMTSVKGVQVDYSYSPPASGGYKAPCTSFAYYNGEVVMCGDSMPQTIFGGFDIHFDNEYTPSPEFYEWWVANFTKQ